MATSEAQLKANKKYQHKFDKVQIRVSHEEKAIIDNRYMKDYTQSETSKLVGMSQVQVSRKEQKVLQKLKQKMVA